MAGERIRRRDAVSRTPEAKKTATRICLQRRKVGHRLRDELQHGAASYAIRPAARLGLALRVGRGLSRHPAKKIGAARRVDRADFVLTDESIRRYGATARAGVREICRYRLFRQEYMHHQSADRFVVVLGMHNYRSRSWIRHARAGPLRLVYALH